MRNPLHRLTGRITRAFKLAESAMGRRAVDTIESEVQELENIFGVLVLGAFIGIPSPPVHLMMELLPLMADEMDVMLEKVATAYDPLGELFSIFDFG